MIGEVLWLFDRFENGDIHIEDERDGNVLGVPQKHLSTFAADLLLSLSDSELRQALDIYQSRAGKTIIFE